MFRFLFPGNTRGLLSTSPLGCRSQWQYGVILLSYPYEEYEQQCDRITRIVSRKNPKAKCVFDIGFKPERIRFSVKLGGMFVIQYSGDHMTALVQAVSDEDLSSVYVPWPVTVSTR